jgi:hypothetical protein
MNCILDIFDTFLSGTTEGGEWEVVGFSLNPAGPFGAGGNWPWATNVVDHVAVDFTNIQQGYYRLNYFMPGDCGGQVGVTIPVVGSGNAGANSSIVVCSDSGLVNIADELGAIFDAGILQAGFTIAGSGTASGSYNAGNLNTPLDDTFDPSTAAVGFYQFILTITPQTPPGYTLDGCDQCNETIATLNIEVSVSSVSIALAGCWLYLDSQQGCSGSTIQIQKRPAATWINVAGSLPYQVDEDADWRIRAIGCDCAGAIVSNIVTSSGCCTDSPDFVIEQGVGLPCFILRTSGTPCAGGTYRWEKSCDNGQSWIAAPYGDTDQISIGDNCWYQLIRDCPSGCEQRSNVLQINNCSGSCNGSLQAVANGCNLDVNTGVICSGTGTFTLQQDINGTYTNVSTLPYSGYPVSFPISQNGTYRVSLDCDGDNCSLFFSAGVLFSNCGGAPVCNSTLSLTLNECTITANITNCPNPFIVFKSLGSQVQSGSNPVYNALVNGLHTVEVYNCPDCGVLNDGVNVFACNTGCSSGLTATANGCLVTASATNCPSPTYIFKQGNTTLQSGPSNTYLHPTEQSVTITVQVIGCPGCSTIETFVQINCVNCNCSTGITNTNCELFANDVGCSGYAAQWRYFNTNTSSWEVKGTGASIVPDENGLWQRRLTKSGCADVTEQINVTCLATPCTLVFNSAEVDSGDCNQIIFTYQGAIADNITLLLNYNLAGTSCGTAGGWASFSPAAGSSFNYLPNGTGSGTIVVPPSLVGKCIRLILIDNDNGGCAAIEERVFFPACCDATPSIQATGCAPYTLSVINAPGGSTYMWSTGGTGSSIEVYDGTFTVAVMDGDCVYNLGVSVTCCADPCQVNFQRCVHYNWLNALSQGTTINSYITKFAINGSNLYGTPQVMQWWPSVFVPGSGNTVITNPSLVNTLNFLSNNLMAFELATFADYGTCFNTPPVASAFLGLLRIWRSTCVTSFEIVIALTPGSPVFGAGTYRYTQNGLEVFLNGIWSPADAAYGTTYMIDNGPCGCGLIDLCA